MKRLKTPSDRPGIDDYPTWLFAVDAFLMVVAIIFADRFGPSLEALFPVAVGVVLTAGVAWGVWARAIAIAATRRAACRALEREREGYWDPPMPYFCHDVAEVDPVAAAKRARGDAS